MYLWSVLESVWIDRAWLRILLVVSCCLKIRTRLDLLSLKKNSHIQRIGCQPEKTTLHGGQSRPWSAEQGKENKRSLAAYPPPPPLTLLVRIIKITRRTFRRSSRVRARISSVCRLGTRPMGVASQNSTLPFAITSFPVSLLLFSGDA